MKIGMEGQVVCVRETERVRKNSEIENKRIDTKREKEVKK